MPIPVVGKDLIIIYKDKQKKNLKNQGVFCLPACLPAAWLPACLTACPPARPTARPPACLPACRRINIKRAWKIRGFSACLPARLPACLLHACLHAWLPVTITLLRETGVSKRCQQFHFRRVLLTFTFWQLSLTNFFPLDECQIVWTKIHYLQKCARVSDKGSSFRIPNVYMYRL